MTENPYAQSYPDPLLTADDPALTAGGSHERADGPPQGSANTATAKASQVGEGTAQAGRQVLGTATEQAASVAGDARDRAREVTQQAREEVRGQAQTQQQRVSDGLHQIGDELGAMSSPAPDGIVTDLTRQASQVAHDAASWLEQRDPGQLLDEVRAFARRRPGAFVGIALGAGVLAGRLTRGAVASARQGPSHAGTSL